jgi:hypothetical protein
VSDSNSALLSVAGFVFGNSALLSVAGFVLVIGHYVQWRALF